MAVFFSAIINVSLNAKAREDLYDNNWVCDLIMTVYHNHKMYADLNSPYVVFITWPLTF